MARKARRLVPVYPRPRYKPRMAPRVTREFWNYDRQRERVEWEMSLTPMMLSLTAMDTILRRYINPRRCKPKRRTAW
jgi:hypothetical protein